MALDLDAALSTQFTAITVEVDRGRLRQFAAAIGESDPIYRDVAAAQQAGHRDLPVPPTYLFSLEMDSADPFAYLTELDVDLRQVLHGEQSFTYHLLAYAGDTLSLQPSIVDAYSKRGRLDFLVKRTRITRDDGAHIADAEAIVVIRNRAEDKAS